MRPILFNEPLPQILDGCARTAYEAYARRRRERGSSEPSWNDLNQESRDDWERVAFASVTEYASQIAAAEVNTRMRDAALKHLLASGG